MAVRRILSLDGGGMKGTFHAAFLAVVEAQFDRPVAAHFDLIAGTSTGGIVALGLGLGFTAQEILNLYENLGPEVFGRRRWPWHLPWLRRLPWILRPRYEPAPLEAALRRAFSDRRLGESRTRLVIPSLNLETGEVHVYKTAHHLRFTTDYKVPVVEVAMATAAAPTYFPTHRSTAGIPLVDGGLWANNPVGMAVVEAIGVLDWNHDDLRVLSLGCPAAHLDAGSARSQPKGELYWARRVVDVFMAGQSSGSLGTAQLLAGHANVYRVCPTVPAGRFALDSIEEVASLRGLGSSEARKALPKLRGVFFADPAATFEPYHR
jgi:hypothetical protein